MHILMLLASMIAYQTSVATEVLSLMPVVIETAVDDSREGIARAPGYDEVVVINTTSFAVHASMRAFSDISIERVAEAIRRPFRAGTPGTAVMCKTFIGQAPSDCRIRNGDLYIELNYLMQSAGGYDVIMTWKKNGPQLYGVGGIIFSRVLRLRFEKNGQMWKLISRTILSET
jgi:hypothetical protein